MDNVPVIYQPTQYEPYGPCLPGLCISFDSHPLWPNMDFYHVDNVPVIYQPTQYEPYGPCLPEVCVSFESHPLWPSIDFYHVDGFMNLL